MSFIIRDIHMTLDTASIENAIRQVEDVRDRLIPALEKLVKQLTEDGREIARARLMMFSPPAYYTGLLYESMNAQAEGTKGTITADTFYAAYVEFGTGAPGQLSAVNESAREEGTYTQTGWYYFNETVGRVLWTAGMAARPFMYYTFRDLETEVQAAGGTILAEYLA